MRNFKNFQRCIEARLKKMALKEKPKFSDSSKNVKLTGKI